LSEQSNSNAASSMPQRHFIVRLTQYGRSGSEEVILSWSVSNVALCHVYCTH